MKEEFEKCGGLDALEQLQYYCPNQHIYKRVQHIIVTHFGIVDGQNEKEVEDETRGLRAETEGKAAVNT